jgi:hypothetical protein
MNVNTECGIIHTCDALSDALSDACDALSGYRIPFRTLIKSPPGTLELTAFIAIIFKTQLQLPKLF